ncbi:SET domain-containing protein [Gymnopus androsaceus JB14]|uniref:SET domain-containing protein n=1 Tax=Gymnopus androsaceus JB14 TaxID=1447944 RepID=A0A6A4I9K2_9AGAR|nr:SET domain-containing protein [Gymnopus androsaceus JB14]
MYSALPQSVEVRRSKLSGRGIWAKNPIRAGSVIIVAKPYASTLSSENLQSYCSSCFAPSGPDGMKRCTKCRTVYYCDSTCQNNDWKIHKHECTSLQNWFQAAPSSDTLPPSDAVRCMSRMLWKGRKTDSTVINRLQAKEIANMQSHRTNVKSSAYETYTHLAHALVQYMSLTNPSDLAEFGLSSAADLVDIISRFVTNTFTVTDPALTPLGAAVSPLVALINHSCDPNAVVVFPRTAGDPKSQEPLMQVVAIQDIYPEEDSYIDVTLPTSSRQQALEETYHFKCTCHLCTSKTDVDPREAMNCPKNCGGLCPLPSDEHSLVRCAKCKSVVKSVEATLDAVRVGQQGLDKATRLQMTDPAKSIQLTTNLIPILTSAGLSPSSHPLLGLTRLHQSLLTASFPDPLTQDHLDETIRTATKNITGLATLLREGHPVLALAVTELGKLLAVDEPSPQSAPSQNIPTSMAYPPSGLPRLNLARDTLLRARNMLLVGFGTVNEGGQVGGEVREMIVALEKEIDVFKQGVRNVLEDRPKIKT